jgi:hypothetical protein
VMGHGRFLVTSWTKGSAGLGGTVFEGPEGNKLMIRAARSGPEAESIAAAAGAGAQVFAVLPELGWPDENWITADPEFWRARLAWLLGEDKTRLETESKAR